MQPGAVRGGGLGVRGGLARGLGVDCVFGVFPRIRMFGALVHSVGSRGPAEVKLCIERVCVGLQSVCSSPAGAAALVPNAAAINGDLDTYEG